MTIDILYFAEYSKKTITITIIEIIGLTTLEHAILWYYFAGFQFQTIRTSKVKFIKLHSGIE